MKAALYLRSSKDRSDVSLAAQRHELEKLAASRSLEIVQSYEDAVESGSTEDRPGFIELVRSIKNAGRGWTHLLVYDTSRLARRRYIAQAIKHEAKKRGIAILYARLPADLDPVAELILESVFEAMDEAHSLMSREKGLAGMAQNVRLGWRAGGRAPLGYQLLSHNTGTIREGRPVMKTTLILTPDARAVGVYLKARAIGVPRVRAIAQAGLKKSPSTMIGIEWNALAYAGHTVWNRHAPEGAGVKRRPRESWQVTRNTHDALITDTEAEAILVQLETSDIGRAVSLAKASVSRHPLTGLLFSSKGLQWVAHGRYYRLRHKDRQRGRLVAAEKVNRAVAAQVQADCASDLFLTKLLEAGRRYRQAQDPTAQVEASIERLEKEKARAATLALSCDDDTFVALVADRTRQIAALRHEAAALRSEQGLTAQVATLTPAQIREHLNDQGPIRAIETLVERIILDPDLTCRLQYKALPGRAAWRSMASPKGCDRWPHELTVSLAIA